MAGVLVATTTGDQPTALGAAVYVVSTIIVFWLAHAWADTLAARVSAGSRSASGYASSLRREWPLVQSAFPPLAAMAIAALFGSSDENAIAVAVWTCVGLLVGWGVVIGRREGLPPVGVVLTAAECGALGMVMVALKVLVH